MSWILSVRETIIPLSSSDVLSEALKEWDYTGLVTEVVSEQCQLCGHPELSWHFHIKNRETRKSLLVGSKCVELFWKQKDEAEGTNNADAIIKDMHEKIREWQISEKHNEITKCIEFAVGISDDLPDNFIDTWKSKRKFTPKQALWLINVLNKHEIKFNNTSVKITLKKIDKFLDYYCRLGYLDRAKIFVCLTSQQKKSLLNISKTRQKHINRELATL